MVALGFDCRQACLVLFAPCRCIQIDLTCQRWEGIQAHHVFPNEGSQRVPIAVVANAGHGKHLYDCCVVSNMFSQGCAP